MVYSQTHWALKPRRQPLQTALRDCCEEVREKPRCRGVFAKTNKQKQKTNKKKPGSWGIKRLLLNSENQISQVNESSILPGMGRCKSLGSLNSFLWCAPQLSGASVLLLSILNPPRVHSWGSCSGWGLDGSNILCLLRWQAIFFVHSASS